MIYFTYAIKSIDKNYIYVGLTNNIRKRLKQHNNGQVKSTKFYKPFKIILEEKYINRIRARQREKYLKSGCGKEFLKNLKTE